LYGRIICNYLTGAQWYCAPVFYYPYFGKNTKRIEVEKHVPEVKVEGNKVTAVVGSVEHPMISEHYIQFIALETEKGSQIKYLKPEEKPEASFCVQEGDKAVAVYEYCNLHGLWKKEL